MGRRGPKLSRGGLGLDGGFGFQKRGARDMFHKEVGESKTRGCCEPMCLAQKEVSPEGTAISVHLDFCVP